MCGQRSVYFSGREGKALWGTRVLCTIDMISRISKVTPLTDFDITAGICEGMNVCAFRGGGDGGRSEIVCVSVCASNAPL